MFGCASTLGQSSGSPFLWYPPFVRNPFGSTTHAQTGSSIFGGTSNGVYGAAQSPFPSFTTFGASFFPAYGNTMPAFGACPTPAFSSSSSSIAGVWLFRPFGSTCIPAFGAASTPAAGVWLFRPFGSTCIPAFGAASTPAFGATSIPTFGGTSMVFGSTMSPQFGNAGAFGASSTGATGSPLFGSGRAFGPSSTPAFGSSGSTFGTSNNTVSGASSTAGFGSPFGAQSTTYGNTAVGIPFSGGRGWGSRVAAYTPTTDPDGTAKFGSISAMPIYGDKSHEELRWKDYQMGVKAFGQSSSSPFASQSVFGQTNNTSNNPFAPKPFGSTTPFGAQTRSSIFGATSTSVSGAAQSSSPFPSTNFGASSSPAFGNTMPAFGASSSPAFNSTPSLFGGSSGFGQKPVFGTFGATSAQTSPFGSTAQPSQPAFGSSIFGSSTPFGGSSQPAFGASTPAFGATSSGAFGATTSPTFGSTGGAFGVSNSPLFGSGGAFGASSTPAFGSSSSTFGTSSNSAFGASSAPGIGSSSTTSFNFSSTPAFGQSSSTFGSGQFGASSPFGAHSSSLGAQSTTFGNTGFGRSAFGGQQCWGTRVVAYSATPEPDGASGGTSAPAIKLESISAMPAYKEKSHEELCWEDCQLGDKGGPTLGGRSCFSLSTTQSNVLNPEPAVAQISSSPFHTFTPSDTFGRPTPSIITTVVGASSTPFTSPTFKHSNSPNIFAPSSSSSGFGKLSSPSVFSSSATPTSAAFAFPASAPTTTSTFNPGLFNSIPSIAQIAQAGGTIGLNTTSCGGLSTTAFGHANVSQRERSTLEGKRRLRFLARRQNFKNDGRKDQFPSFSCP